MVQVARGYWYDGHITPTLEIIESEWHVGCYDGPLNPQYVPYTCEACHEQIRNHDYVIYITFGDAPEESYVRPERRGYQLARIEHHRCPRRARH
jgi:hypothetical protein